MSINLIISLCIIVIGLLIPDNQKSRKWFCIFIGLLLILQNALRTNYEDNDTIRYFMGYQAIMSESFSSLIQDFSFFGTSYQARDLGYPIFVKLTQLVSTNFVFYLFVVAIIIIVPIMVLVYRLSPSNAGVITACVVFESLFANFFETGIRQTVAMGLMLFAFNWVLKNKKWKFVLVVALVSTIHTSAWLFLPAAFVNSVKKPKQAMLLMLIAMPFIMLFASNIIAFIGSGTMYSGYAVNSSDNLGTPVFSALLTAIGIVVYLASDKIQKRFPAYANTLILMIGAAVTLMPSSWVDSNFIRIVFYYAIFILVSVPASIECLFQKSTQKLVYVLVNGVLIFLQIV